MRITVGTVDTKPAEWREIQTPQCGHVLCALAALLRNCEAHELDANVYVMLPLHIEFVHDQPTVPHEPQVEVFSLD